MCAISRSPAQGINMTKNISKLHVNKIIRTPCNQIPFRFTLPFTSQHLRSTAKVSARLRPSQFNYFIRRHCCLWNVYHKPQSHVFQGVRWSLTSESPSLPAWFATGTPSSTRACIGRENVVIYGIHTQRMICIHVKHKTAWTFGIQYLAIELHEEKSKYSITSNIITIYIE